MWRDPERPVWLDRWNRRGEVAFTAGLTSAVTAWATGTNWIPITVASGFALVGIYLILAAECAWWLPGRKRFNRESSARFIQGAFDDVLAGDSESLRHIGWALDRLYDVLNEFEPEWRRKRERRGDAEDGLSADSDPA